MSKLVKASILAAAGFVAGILIAPRSGKQTRADIKKKANGLKHQAEDAVREAKTVAKQSARTVKAGAKEVAAEAKEFGDEVAASAKKTSRKVASTTAKTAKSVKAEAVAKKPAAKKTTKK